MLPTERYASYLATVNRPFPALRPFPGLGEELPSVPAHRRHVSIGGSAFRFPVRGDDIYQSPQPVSTELTLERHASFIPISPTEGQAVQGALPVPQAPRRVTSHRRAASLVAPVRTAPRVQQPPQRRVTLVERAAMPSGARTTQVPRVAEAAGHVGQRLPEPDAIETSADHRTADEQEDTNSGGTSLAGNFRKKIHANTYTTTPNLRHSGGIQHKKTRGPLDEFWNPSQIDKWLGNCAGEWIRPVVELGNGEMLPPAVAEPVAAESAAIEEGRAEQDPTVGKPGGLVENRMSVADILAEREKPEAILESWATAIDKFLDAEKQREQANFVDQAIGKMRKLRLEARNMRERIHDLVRSATMPTFRTASVVPADQEKNEEAEILPSRTVAAVAPDVPKKADKAQGRKKKPVYGLPGLSPRSVFRLAAQAPAGGSVTSSEDEVLSDDDFFVDGPQAQHQPSVAEPVRSHRRGQSFGGFRYFHPQASDSERN
jgi:hypothetical protein